MRIKHFLRCLGYDILPLRMYLKLCYRFIYRKKLDIDNPKRFSEKIYWLKLYYNKYQKETIQKCYDKYTVREHIKEKIGESYLNELYGVYNSADEIDFDTLPNQFVLKITQSSGKNIICVDKNKLDIAKIKKQLDEWLDDSNCCRGQEESYYFNGNAKIICEKLLKTRDGKIPSDYRVYCFNGKPAYVIYDIDTTLEDGSHGHFIRRNVYDLNWNYVDVEMGRPNDKDAIIPKPENFAEMIEISQKLSIDFPFVRVDLYNLEEKIIFGELTWIPMGGNCVISPDSFDLELGNLLRLPDAKISFNK